MTAEGEKRAVFQNEICINLDKIESFLARSEKRSCNKTMDLCFGALENNAKQIVLCECRFNYQNADNLSKTDLDAKMAYSKQLTGNEIAIHNHFIFLFKTGVKNQAYNKLRRLYSNRDFCKVLDIHEFKQVFFN